MTGLSKRLITAAVVLPALFVIIAFMPWFHLAPFCIVVMVCCYFGTYEMNTLLSRRGETPKTAYLGLLLPVAEYVHAYVARSNVDASVVSFMRTINLPLFTLIAVVVFALIYEVFRGAADNFKDTIGRAGRAISNIVYPGLFSIYLIRFAFIEGPVKSYAYISYAGWYIIFFLLLVMGSDTSAYFTGMLFGKGNRGHIKASPNKSIAGYFGGTIIPGIIGLIAPLCFPKIFDFTLWQGFILGFVTAIFAALGDLIESGIKRGVEAKDSGVIFPGRGGMLDSLDSIMVAAPVFIFILDCFGKYLPV